MKKWGCLILVLSFSTSGWGATTYVPLLNGNFMSGQYFFDGKESSLGGNIGLTFVPAVRFSSEFSLIPSLDSNYRGTRSAEELAGGNTLFQDTWENGINVKAVHSLSSSWKLKERLGARMKWYRETTNETWNKGLYDWRSESAGLELENRLNRDMKWSVGYDFSLLQFPNYESLEASQPSTLAREYAGAHPLDNSIHLLSAQLNSPLFWDIGASVKTYYSPRYYTDQTVVELTGLLSSTKRKDTFTGGGLEFDRMFHAGQNSKLIAGINYDLSKMDSNQNHYDAKQTTFIGNFYDYTQNRIGGTLTWAFCPRPAGLMILETGYSYSKRNYSDRLTQDPTGAYLADKLTTVDTAFNIGFSYPLSKSLRLRTSSTLGRSRSNTHFEELYRYNFSNANYLFGFTYDY